MTNKISIETFLLSPTSRLLLDVRTPAEFEKGHVPNAHNLPIFSNEERVKIGTTYKQKGREEAILLGLELTGPKWRYFIEEALKIAPNKKVALYCWRGGMRSAAMAWVLRFYGFEVQLIEGGYKKYRNWVLRQFEKPYPFLVLGGKTGSHKTEILRTMEKFGEQVIDLEGLAQHQGSAFGSMNKFIQPSQEHFENILAMKLLKWNCKNPIWIEDESRMIGKRSIPNSIYDKIRVSPVIQIKLPLSDRVTFLTQEYGNLDSAFLVERTGRITKRLGPQHAKSAIEFIKKGDIRSFIETVLVYYDKAYKKGLEKRNENTVFPIDISFRNVKESTQELLNFSKKMKYK